MVSGERGKGTKHEMAGSFGRRARVGVRYDCGSPRMSRHVNDPGGEITAYVHKFQEMRASGERLVIDGPCLSACTLFTAFIPRDPCVRHPPGGARLPRRVLLRRRPRSLVPTRPERGW
jgi:hypothetical protein